MELNETVKKMNSLDYKDRFKAEYQQTKIRYEKLNQFITRIELAIEYPEKIEKPKYDCPLSLLREQREIMFNYLQVLVARAVVEKIEL